MIVSARALSQLSPTLPTEGAIPASARRSPYLIETYCTRCAARGVQHAAVAVMNEIVAALAGPTLVEGLFQCMENELGRRSARNLPADDPSGEDVDGPVQRTKAV